MRPPKVEQIRENKRRLRVGKIENAEKLFLEKKSKKKKFAIKNKALTLRSANRTRFENAETAT